MMPRGRGRTGLVPRTRSSRTHAAGPIANFGFKRGTRSIRLLVSFRFRSSHESVLQGVANFGIGTLVAREFRRAVLAFATLAVLSVPTQTQRAAPPEPQGYRTENYRAATPAGLAGAHTLSTAEAEALWRQRVAVFIDVMPHPPRPQNLPAGTVWRDKPRFNIPGSIWLPDTGY